MIVRALDSNGDWTFGAGLNNYKVNRDAVAQNIQTRLSSFLGDCFFDTGAGINWFFFLSSKEELALNLAVSSVILNTAYVSALVQLSIILDPSTRRLTIQYKVTTAFGTVTTTLSTNEVSLLTEGGFELLTEGGAPLVTE